MREMCKRDDFLLVHQLHKPEVYLYLYRVEKIQHLELLYGQLSDVPSHSCMWHTTVCFEVSVIP